MGWDEMGWDGNVELSNQSMLCGLWYKREGRKGRKGKEDEERRGDEMRREERRGDETDD